jgi:sodium/proline symporter
MGMKDDAHVRLGRNIAVLWTVLAYGGAFVIGVGALVLFGPSAVKDPEMILPHVLTQMFPPWLAGILLAGAVAAMISTAESMLLVAASSVSQDVYKGIIKEGRAEERKVLAISRAATLGIGIFALVLSLTTSKLIYTIVSYAWAGIGCSFAPAVLLSFYWDKFNSKGVITALVAGLLTTVVWMVTGLEKIITARAVTFFVAMGLAVLVSLLTGGKEELARNS